MRALNHLDASLTHAETVVRIVGQWPGTHDFESSWKGNTTYVKMCMLSYIAILDSGVSRLNFRVSGPIAGINPYACILFPDIGVMNV